MPQTTIILPHTVPEKNRKRKFDADMELTAVISLAEAGRKATEKIMFIAKLHYPLWAVPWENSCLIIDGLQTLSPKIAYLQLPDTQMFLDDVERSQTDQKQFRMALEKHSHTFDDFSRTVEFSAEAILVDRALLSDISEYVEHAKAVETATASSVILLPPELNKASAEERRKTVLDIYEKIQSDIKTLEHLAGVLTETAQFHEKKMLHEVELADAACREEIARIQPDVDAKVEFLLKERDAKIKKLNKTAEGILNTLLRQHEKRQRELEKLEIERAEIRGRLDSGSKRRSKTGVTRWEHRLRICERKISAAREAVQELSEHLERTRRRNEAEVNNLKYDYQALIDLERKKITDIKVKQEALIRAKRDEIKQLQLSTRGIVDLMGALKEQKNVHAGELKRLTIPWQQEQTSFLCVPFYLVRYKSGNKYSHRLFPPLRAMGPEGIVKRIKKALLSFSLRARLKLLLQPRSKSLGRMLGLLVEEKMRTDSDFKDMMGRLGASNDLLLNSELREVLTKGLTELRAEGWIKPEEETAVMKIYVQE